ncbi:MAG: UV DNA damage repair endonuclease UvsE [bacterium]
MIRLGLCCKFTHEPIRFYTTTARYVSGLSSLERYRRISQLCLQNAQSLLSAIEYCNENTIGCFRVNSKILPLKTHPDFGYAIKQLPQAEEIEATFKVCGRCAQEYALRLTFHPDQFILLSSPDSNITRKSIQELEYQAEVSEWIGADVITIHGGGAYGDKDSALARLTRTVEKLPIPIRERLALENDDRVYTPADLLPFCQKNNVPFVYDVHHHRCLPDHLSVEQATEMALTTWDREPLFHISSPKCGWNNAKQNFHHDYIALDDFPSCWRDLNITVEVEAKAKELAVKKLWQKFLCFI